MTEPTKLLPKSLIKNDGLTIDTEFTDLITCPYCGSKENDSWEVHDTGIQECGNCGKQFNLTAIDYDVHYTTEKIVEAKP